MHSELFINFTVNLTFFCDLNDAQNVITEHFLAYMCWKYSYKEQVDAHANRSSAQILLLSSLFVIYVISF